MGVPRRTKQPQHTYAGQVETTCPHTFSAESFVFCHVKPLLPCSISEILRAVPKNRWRSSPVVRQRGESLFPEAPWGTALCSLAPPTGTFCHDGAMRWLGQWPLDTWGYQVLGRWLTGNFISLGVIYKQPPVLPAVVFRIGPGVPEASPPGLRPLSFLTHAASRHALCRRTPYTVLRLTRGCGGPLHMCCVKIAGHTLRCAKKSPMFYSPDIRLNLTYSQPCGRARLRQEWGTSAPTPSVMQSLWGCVMGEPETESRRLSPRRGSCLGSRTLWRGRVRILQLPFFLKAQGQGSLLLTASKPCPHPRQRGLPLSPSSFSPLLLGCILGSKVFLACFSHCCNERQQGPCGASSPIILQLDREGSKWPGFFPTALEEKIKRRIPLFNIALHYTSS